MILNWARSWFFRKGRKKRTSSDILSEQVKASEAMFGTSAGEVREVEKIFYLCDGNVDACSKRNCFRSHKNKNVCKHTTDIKHAINFQKSHKLGAYYENENA